MNVVEEPVRRPSGGVRAWVRMALLAAITVLVFVLLFRSVSLGSVVKLLRAARPLPLIVGIILTPSFPILSAIRWRVVMEGLGQRLSLRESMSMIMACFTLSTFTPSKGGDLARAYFMRSRAPVSLVLGSVLAERLLDVMSLLLFCLLGAWIYRWRMLAALAGVLFLAGVLMTVALLLIRLPVPSRFRPKVERLLLALRMLRQRPGLLSWVLLLTIAHWLVSIVQTWLFYLGLHAPVPLGRVLAALPAAIFVGLLPVTIGGMGTRDATLIRLLAEHAPAAASLGVGLLYSLCGYWLPGLAGLPFLRALLSATGAPPPSDGIEKPVQ